MGFHGGKADAPTQTRLFLPFSCFLIWMALEWVKAQRKILKMGLGILLLASSLFSLWISRSYLEEFPHPMTAQFKALREILSRSEGVKLFVYANPGLITAFGQAAIQPWRYMRDEVWQRQEGKLAWVESWPTMAPSLSRPEWLVPENLKEELYYAKLQSLRLWERPEKGAWKKD